MDMSPAFSLQHNPVVNYLRKRPNSLATRCLSLPLKTWRSLNTEPVEPYTKSVPLDHLLCGGELGLSAAQYARHTGNYRRPSTPITRSPHVQFLEQYQQIGEEIFRPDVFRQTAYYAHAVECINAVGEYLTCTHENQLEGVARQFIALFRGEPSQDDAAARSTHFRPPGSVVYVRPVQYSDYFEVRDGMHQLAIAHVQGQRTYQVYVMPPAVLTPIQQLILDHAFCRASSREYYHPLDAPELSGQWTLIRRCTDRFGMMQRFLEEHDLMPPNCRTSLDIACSYGWFVRAFGQLGFDAYGGGEIDWAACEIGRRMYGLREDQVTRSEVVRFLENNTKRYDIVSCLSLLHHFIIGLPYRASISAEEMLRLIDRTTGTVLFFDMGEEHEEWFRTSLAGWNPDHIERWLRENSSFTKIYRLGTDRDNVPPFENNYGRTLFACMR